MSFVIFKDIYDLLKAFHKQYGYDSNAITQIRELEKRKKTSNIINTVNKRSLLTHEEFLEARDQSQILIETSKITSLPDNDEKRQRITKDSLLIPPFLDCKAIAIFPFHKADYHRHSCFDIYYVYKGQGTLSFEDTQKELYEGDLCIVAPNSSHKIHCVDDSILIDIYIRKSTFDKVFFNTLTEYGTISTFIRSVFYGSKTSNYLLFKRIRKDTADELIKNIFVETNYIDSFSNSSCIHYINLLFTTIIRDFNFNDCYYDFKDTQDNIIYNTVI